MFKAIIDITLRSSILDPQGKAVQSALHNLGYSAVQSVRVGKHIELEVEAVDAEAARAVADEACRKLLANEVMEDFRIVIQAAQESVVD